MKFGRAPAISVISIYSFSNGHLAAQFKLVDKIVNNDTKSNLNKNIVLINKVPKPKFNSE